MGHDLGDALRWHHSTRGIVPPAQFIALAEQTSVGQLLGQLKIDKSFVRDLLTKPGGASVARSVVALGCDTFQGYFFGRPAPAAKLYCI